MPKNAPLSLSIQREIKKHRIHVESEIDKPMGQLGKAISVSSKYVNNRLQLLG
jgi:hypothetical protein